MELWCCALPCGTAWCRMAPHVAAWHRNATYCNTSGVVNIDEPITEILNRNTTYNSEGDTDRFVNHKSGLHLNSGVIVPALHRGHINYTISRYRSQIRRPCDMTLWYCGSQICRSYAGTAIINVTMVIWCCHTCHHTQVTRASNVCVTSHNGRTRRSLVLCVLCQLCMHPPVHAVA